VTAESTPPSTRAAIPVHDRDDPRSLRQRLWWIAIAPSLWAVHLLVCYIAAAIWCEKVARPQSPRPPSPIPLWIVVAAATVVVVIVILVIARLSWRNFRRSDQALPLTFDTPEERTAFLGFTAFLLSVLSLVATLFTVLVFVLVRSCD